MGVIAAMLTSLVAAEFSALKADQATQHAETLAAIAAVSTRVGALQGSVGALEARMGALEARVGALEARVGAMEASVRVLRAASANERVRLNNSLKANVAPLQPFAFDREGNPWPAGIEQPPTLLDLAVAGNESKPGQTDKPAWNKTKSKAFLKAAVDGYDSDGTDGEGEMGTKARTVRVKVIQAIGGNVASVFATQYQLF